MDKDGVVARILRAGRYGHEGHTITTRLTASLAKHAYKNQTNRDRRPGILEDLQAEFSDSDYCETLAPLFAEHLTEAEVTRLAEMFNTPEMREWCSLHESLVPAVEDAKVDWEKKILDEYFKRLGGG